MHQNHVLKPSLKLSLSAKGDYHISVTLEGKRHRYSSGSAIGVKLHPNRLPKGRLRDEAAEELLLCFREAVRDGWLPTASNSPSQTGPEQSLLEGLRDYRPAPHLSEKYKVELLETRGRLLEHFTAVGAKAILPSQLDQIQVLATWRCDVHAVHLQPRAGKGKLHLGFLGSKNQGRHEPNSFHSPKKDGSSATQAV